MSRQRSKTGQPVTADLPQRSEVKREIERERDLYKLYYSVIVLYLSCCTAQAEEGLGDIEGSSHSEGKPLSPLPTGTSRPNTKYVAMLITIYYYFLIRKKRRRTSRGVPVGPSGGLSDGYDTTVDQVRGVPPSRQVTK